MCNEGIYIYHIRFSLCHSSPSTQVFATESSTYWHQLRTAVMSFLLAQTASPLVVEDQEYNNGTDEDLLSSALHSALNFTSPGSSHHSSQATGDHEMLHEKSRTGLEIIVNPETICLKGTGPEVEPALLSGHVALHLTESTSIKEITLSFRGKARLPLPSHEP